MTDASEAVTDAAVLSESLQNVKSGAQLLFRLEHASLESILTDPDPRSNVPRIVHACHQDRSLRLRLEPLLKDALIAWSPELSSLDALGDIIILIARLRVTSAATCVARLAKDLAQLANDAAPQKKQLFERATSLSCSALAGFSLVARVERELRRLFSDPLVARIAAPVLFLALTEVRRSHFRRYLPHLLTYDLRWPNSFGIYFTLRAIARSRDLGLVVDAIRVPMTLECRRRYAELLTEGPDPLSQAALPDPMPRKKPATIVFRTKSSREVVSPADSTDAIIAGVCSANFSSDPNLTLLQALP